MRLIAAIWVAAALARAQESVHRGSISGRVTDPSGAVVPGASVSARHLETGLAAVTTTDREGRFRLPYLRIGGYRLSVLAPGFQETVHSITLGTGAAYELPIALAVGAEGTRVEVSAEGAAIEAARSQIAVTTGRTEVESLPLNGRNFLDLALLVPGVSITNTGSNQLFAETSAVPGQGLSVASQRNFSNNFVVDGLSANDDAAGLSGAFYGLETVQEFQVVTSGAQAEFGRALGGFVSVVTRSGTNQFHGDLYGYFRNQRWNAANPLSGIRLPLTQAQYGASAGGPIERDRAFYFANFEQRQLNQSGLVAISPAAVAAVNRRLDETGYQGARIATGIYPDPVHMTNGLAKADRQFGARDQLSLRYSVYRVDSLNSRGAGGLSAATASAGLDNTDHTVAAGNVYTASARTVNETRGQITRSDLEAPPSDPVGPSVSIAGVASFGRLSGSPAARSNRMYEVVDNLSHQEGAHALRAGASFLFNGTAIEFPRSVRGAYTFSSLAAFLQGAYNNAGYSQTFGARRVALANPNLSVYAQDEWKALPSLTLNIGARYEVQWLPSIAADRDNLSPRAGFAWRPWRTETTVVRGGFGLYYDRIPLRALANALLSSRNTTAITPSSQVTATLSPAQAGAPVFPNVLAAMPAGVLANFTTMDPHIPNAYSAQGSVEIEHRVSLKTTVSAGYQHMRGLHLIASINRNVPACAAAGTNNGCRPNPDYANNSQYRGQGDSRYDGLHLSFQHRASRGSVRISYAFSKSLNDAGEFFFNSPVDPFNIWRDWGRSDDDQRHRLTVNGALRAVKGFELSGWLQYTSAFPLNITTGATTIQGTAARPEVNGVFIDRNAGSGSGYLGLNARVSRSFALTKRIRLEGILESFNALNHRNNLTRNGVFGTGAYPSNPSPSFGQVTAVQDPRSFQAALRVRF